MNRQAVVAYAQAWSKEEKIATLRGLSLAYDMETIAAICEYIIEGKVPQTLPAAAPPSPHGGRRARKKARA